MTLPLLGVRVVVTRAEHQSGGLLRALADAGAIPEPLPLLSVAPPADPAPLAGAAARLGEYAWVVFTSSNAVDALLRLAPAPWPRSVRVATVGPATTLALGRAAVRAELVAHSGHAEGLLAELLPRLAPGDRVLLPQAADARPLLRDGLYAAGVAVDAVVAYRKALPEEASAHADTLFPADAPLGWVTFTSPSTARAFAALFGDAWASRRATLRAASIGPVTTAALQALGVEPAAVAATAADAALVAAIAAAVAAAITQP